MNEAEDIKFDEIKIGMIKEFDVEITQKMIDDFARISGDFNPLHTDVHYAEKTKFKKRVAHGFLVGSFLSRLVGMHLPGKNALYLYQTLKFKNPVFENDKLKVVGKVVDKSEELKIITIQTNIIKSTGETVIDGEAKVLYRDDLHEK
jgi:acyl dehydratase